MALFFVGAVLAFGVVAVVALFVPFVLEAQGVDTHQLLMTAEALVYGAILLLFVTVGLSGRL